jgi:D-cysteine desulfhydrase
MHDCALFRRFPALADRIPWLGLAKLPTPVEPLALEASTGRQDLWIKRDDLTAESYGGNKVRKLEFLLASARARGARRLITVGAAGSHHGLATTIYGRALGFDVTLILFPQPLTPHVRDILLLDQAFGAELRYTRRMETVPAALFATILRYRNQKAFVIPAGGSDAVGTLGYVTAAMELAEQIARGEAPEPATVVVAAGTLGTAAGLALGFAIAGLNAKIKAVRITSRIVTNERVLARLIRGAEVLMRRAGADLEVAEHAIRQVELLHEHIGGGYGQETPEGKQATITFAERGIQLDPTYTAKAAAAFVKQMQRAAKPALFWQTLSAAEPRAARQGVTEADLPKPFRDYLSAG